MNKIVGIDLGTSTSEIAIIKEGKPFVIPNHLGDLITPSVVGLAADGRIMVGREARDQLLLKPDDTVIEVKRLMGSGSTVFLGGKEYTPQQISSFILAYLMDCACKYLGEDIDRAVITVPAYFSDTQRRATVEAGKLAGLKVERIINEPTAAALDYGTLHMQECQNILVYDLGGGTLDVTVLELYEGILDVKASCGNNELGGKDFDQRLMEHLLNKFTAQWKTDLCHDKRAMMRLREGVEKCKIALSTEDEYHLLIPFFTEADGNPVSLDERVSRGTFVGLIKDLIDATAKQIDTALSDAALNPSQLDLVLLVGGSTRIPYVKSFIEQRLGQAAQTLVDPDLAVVRGASVQAGIIGNALPAGKEVIITDVCPYTLGTSVLEYVGGFLVTDSYDVIIPRNVTIPVVKEKTYGTAADNQTQVEINVYQGEYRKASHNNLLGKFMLTGIPAAPAFQEKINISFAYDLNGILQVEGIIVSSGKKANLIIETTGVEMEQEIMLEGWNKTPHARRYKAIIRRAERMVETGEACHYAIEMESLIRKLKAGLLQGETRGTLDAYKEDLHELIYELEEEFEKLND